VKNEVEKALYRQTRGRTWLRNGRFSRKGIPCSKIARLVIYLVEDVVGYIENRRGVLDMGEAYMASEKAKSRNSLQTVRGS